MKVKDLIKELQSVKNQDARVDIYVPYYLEMDTPQDYQTDDFEIHRAGDNDEYIEIYCGYDLDKHNKYVGGTKQ